MAPGRVARSPHRPACGPLPRRDRMKPPSDESQSSDPDAPAATGSEGRPLEELVETMYGTLRDLADRQLKRGGGQASVDPTDLVHDCYLKLSKAMDLAGVDRVGFVALAAKVIRNALVDQARRSGAIKRGGGFSRITLHDDVAIGYGPYVDLVDLDDALLRLSGPGRAPGPRRRAALLRRPHERGSRRRPRHHAPSGQRRVVDGPRLAEARAVARPAGRLGARRRPLATEAPLRVAPILAGVPLARSDARRAARCRWPGRARGATRPAPRAPSRA